LISIIASSLIGNYTQAASTSKPDGDIYVQDLANILSKKQKKELIELGTYLEDQTGAQMTVLTVNTLNNQPVEDFAIQSFHEYGLESAEKNNGVLLLLSLEDRKIKIEIGYGIEEILSDAKTGKILDSYALPYLVKDEIDLALMNTYKQLFNEVASGYQLNKKAKTKGYEYGSTNNSPLWPIIISLFIFIGMIVLDFRLLKGAITLNILKVFGAFTRRRNRRRLSSRDNGEGKGS
jgi:uncharacterized protein